LKRLEFCTRNVETDRNENKVNVKEVFRLFLRILFDKEKMTFRREGLESSIFIKKGHSEVFWASIIVKILKKNE